jgi:NAD-dependent deacetylase
VKRIVVFTGAGVSAESGLNTFRDSNGLWEQYRIEDVATPEAWKRDAALVLNFYNQRRNQVINAKPNAAHTAIAQLEKYFQVQVITQNIDDLHERAGSSRVLHLHGEICKSRSTLSPNLIYKLEGADLNIGDKCEKGSQLRPHIVWFGEMVPAMEEAVMHTQKADILLVIGTSLEVYPAASLVQFASDESIKYLIDPKAHLISGIDNLSVINKKAGEGVPVLVKQLIKEYVR